MSWNAASALQAVGKPSTPHTHLHPAAAPAASTALPGGSELQMCVVIESFLHTAAHTAPLGTPPLACASCQEMYMLECICASP